MLLKHSNEMLLVYKLFPTVHGRGGGGGGSLPRDKPIDSAVYCSTSSQCTLFQSTGALKTLRLKYVILDWTWRDQKLRRMIDIPEVQYNSSYNYLLSVQLCAKLVLITMYSKVVL